MNQKGGSKTDTVVKLVLIVFISLLSFSVGTFVGKQVSDSDNKRAALEGDFKAERETASVNHADQGAQEENLSEAELSSLTEEFVQSEKAEGEEQEIQKNDKNAEHDSHQTVAANEHGEKPAAQGNEYKKMNHGKAATAEAPAQEEEASEAAHGAKKEGSKKEIGGEASKEASRVAEGKAPIADAKKERTPTSVFPNVAASAVGKFTVQVASYATEDEAKNYAANLKTKGFSAFYISAQVSGKTWYRVSVGLFSNQQSAMNYRKELMSQANVTSAIVQKIVNN